MHASLSIFCAIPVSRSVFFTKTGEMSNRCSNGHIGVLGTKFCPDCGSRFTMEDVEQHTEVFTQVCAKYGWTDPAAGFTALSDRESQGWAALCEAEGQDPIVYAIKLIPINVEAVYDIGVAPQQVYGLGIQVACISGIGDGEYTTKVLEIPGDGFPAQAAAIQELAQQLGIEGDPNIYPQVSLS